MGDTFEVVVSPEFHYGLNLEIYQSTEWVLCTESRTYDPRYREFGAWKF